MRKSAQTKSVLATAFRRHQDGDLHGAETLYQRVLDAEPENPQALQYIGLVREHRGDLTGATEAYQTALRRDPTNVRLLNRLATALGRAEHYEAAENAVRGALHQRPDFAPAWTTLGNILDGQGRLALAADAFREALRYEPDRPQVHNNLGVVLSRQGLTAEAEDHFRRAIVMAPDMVDALSNLGNLLSQQGQISEALEFLSRAMDLDPDMLPVLINLGEVLAELGELGSAQELFSRALSIDPDLHAARLGLVSTLSKGMLRRYQPSVDRLLGRALAWEDVGGHRLGLLTAEHLKLKHDLPPTMSAMDEVTLNDSLVSGLAKDRLFAGYLGVDVNCDPGLERLLTRLRIRLVEHPDLEADTPLRLLAGALAIQCGVNEYVFATSDEEHARVESWRRQLEAADWHDPDPGLLTTLLRYCLYGSPRALANHRLLADVPLERWPEALRPVIKEEVLNRLREAELAATLPALTPINDAVSQAVAHQYEENPYPRWNTITRRPALGAAATIKTLFPHFEPPERLRGPVDILIAGCGTGQHPIAETALVYKDSRVLGLDLSRTSLGHALRRAGELAVDNVEFAIADILELGDFDRQFDIVEAAGVLHHLDDPVAGWRILRDLVRPGGLIMVALYSRYSRRHIAAARADIAARGVAPTPEVIRAFRDEVLAAGRDGPCGGLLDSSDFYSMSGCRDLVFHAQEHQFTLPEIGEIIDRLELELIGLQHREPSIPRRYRARFPEDARQTDLAKWDQFEADNPKIFANMYYVWCQRPA